MEAGGATAKAHEGPQGKRKRYLSRRVGKIYVVMYVEVHASLVYKEGTRTRLFFQPPYVLFPFLEC